MKVAKAKAKGLYADGGGLYLQVSDRGAKSWVYRYQLHGKARAMGLGPLADVPLAKARAKASEAREQCRQGVDPILARQSQRAAQRLEASKATTFKKAAEDYIAAQAAGWRNEKHKAQWGATLERYAYPLLGALPVQAIDTDLVLRVLRPIWSHKPETASRVRGRIEAILDAAKAMGQRTGDNPASWRGNLKKLLPAKTKVRRVKHHAALPYDALGVFMEDLRKEDGNAADALEFLILTVARTGEVTGAEPKEIDLTNAVWTVPEGRIKGGKEHRVPLSASALAIARRMIGDGEQPYVFPGGKAGKSLSNNAMLALLTRMGRDDITVHGFRSTFKDWATERTSYPNEVSEMALSHVVSNKTEAAYRRGDLFDKRRKLMDEWARFCATVPVEAKVVPIRRVFD